MIPITEEDIANVVKIAGYKEKNPEATNLEIEQRFSDVVKAKVYDEPKEFFNKMHKLLWSIIKEKEQLQSQTQDWRR